MYSYTYIRIALFLEGVVHYRIIYDKLGTLPTMYDHRSTIEQFAMILYELNKSPIIDIVKVEIFL